MALCSNDVNSCCDRILHAIATICMRRLGVPEKFCLMMFGTLTKVKHYIRTTYGDLTTLYSCIELPFQGIYQGNGTGPGIWLLVSIPIINTLSIPALTPTFQMIPPTWFPKCNKQLIHGKEVSEPLEAR
jgi:hypothetical protein